MDIPKIINMSFCIKKSNNDSIVDIKHIKESIKLLYPNNPEYITKCNTFYSKFKSQNTNFHTDNMSDVYLIFRSYNFDQGTENAAYYLLGLLMY